MSSSSQNPAPVSTTRAFADLAAVIDRRVSSDQAAELLYAFRTAVRAEALAEAADEIEGLRQFEKTVGPRRSAQVSENIGILAAAAKLRILAAEGGAS